MMDHSYDYLLPTCMLKRRAMMKNGLVAMEPAPTSTYMDSIFDDTLKALEEDTCSEISDRSYADASYYTQMKLWNSPYLERQFIADIEDTPTITKYQPKSGTSQFDLSLQQFLEWPDSSGGQDSDYEVSLPEVSHYEVTKSKRKSAERRKRATRIHNSSRSLIPQKRLSIPKVEVETDSDCAPQSEDDVFEDNKNIKIDSKKVFQSTVPYRPSSSEESKKLTQLALKSNKSVDSDSDYRTYSDTSSEKLDTNFSSNASDSHREVDLTPLKSLMMAVLQKSESVSSRLQQSKLNQECKTRNETQEQKSSSVKIIPILGKKGGDLEHFKKLLEKVQDLLTVGETAVESLQLQLKDERCLCKEKMEADNNNERLQKEVADLQGQLVMKAKEFENKCADMQTIARQLDVLDTHSQNVHSDMLDRILSEIQLLQSINSAVNPFQLPSLSRKRGGNPANHQQINSATKLMDDFESSNQPLGALQDENKTGHQIGMTGCSNQSVLPDNKLQIQELTIQIDDLKKTLKATEETVHCQTHKMKYYRNILFENGLLHEPRSRSNSVPSTMNKLRTESKLRKRRNSEDIRRSVSPTTMTGRHLNSSEVLESKEDMEKLFKENSKLKEQVNGYRRVLKVFQGKNRTSGSELDGRLGTDSVPRSIESAQCILDCWFGIVDKFLSDLNRPDQDGHLQHSATSTDVARLRMGLLEAKAAVQVLSESYPEEKSSEGRLSPDSACSDNSISAQKMMNVSPLKSPRFYNGSTLSVCSDTKQRETGALPNHYLEKQKKSFDITTEQEMDILSHAVCRGCNMYSMRENKSSVGSQLCVPTICINECVEDNSYDTEAFGHSDFKHGLRKCDEAHSELVDENPANKSKQCCNRSIKMLQNESKHIETSTIELNNRMKSLEKILRSYEEQVRKQFRPDFDSLKDQVTELHDLRVLLEKHMNHNEVLEKDLRDMNNSSDQTIQNLKTQLTQCNKIIQEKIKVISEKDRAIKESNINLEICKDNSSKISAELEFCHKRVASLDTELKTEKDTVNQLTIKCKHLEMEIDRYNKPLKISDKNLNVDIISSKDQKSIMDVKFNTNLDIPELKTRIEELEIVALQWSQNESKYKDMLSKSTSEVKKLSSNLDNAKEEINNRNVEMEQLKAELESSRDTVEEQAVLLCDKTRIIDGLNCELQKQNIILYEQDSLCRELTSKLEDVNTVNGKLSTRLDLDKHICEDYKQQSDKQNQLIHDLKDSIAKLKAELTLSVQMRKSQDEIMIKEKKDVYETIKLKDKYLYNLKMTYRELSRAKKNLKDEHRKLEEISSVNRSLQTELKVRERLMDKKGDTLTLDDKQNMITDLLNELKLLREQITTIQEQNSIMKARLSQFSRHNRSKGLRQSPTTDKPGVPVGTVDQLKKLHIGADKCNTSVNEVTPVVSKN